MNFSGSIIGDINIKKYKELKEEYIKYARSITPLGILEYAPKMKINLNDLYIKLLEHTTTDEQNSIVSTLLGIFGNVCAYEYFLSKFGNIEREVNIKNNDDLICTDLYRKQDDKIYLYEVKTTSQLILNDSGLKNKKITDEIKYGTMEYENIYMKKIYKHITFGLLKQVNKMIRYRNDNENVRICIVLFSDCYVQKGIRKYLSRNNIPIYTIPIEVERMIRDISDLINEIYTYGRNLLDDNSMCPIYKCKKKVKENGTLLDK